MAAHEMNHECAAIFLSDTESLLVSGVDSLI